MSNGTPVLDKKAATWRVVAAFGDQLVIDPEKSLRDLASIQQCEAVTKRSIRIAVIRDDHDDINRAEPYARWDLAGKTPDEVEAAWRDAQEIAECLNDSLGQVVS